MTEYREKRKRANELNKFTKSNNNKLSVNALNIDNLVMKIFKIYFLSKLHLKCNKIHKAVLFKKLTFNNFVLNPNTL